MLLGKFGCQLLVQRDRLLINLLGFLTATTCNVCPGFSYTEAVRANCRIHRAQKESRRWGRNLRLG
jgi:hypothetical protein